LPCWQLWTPKGGGFYDPESDAVFVRELKAHLPSSVRVEERNTHIDDPAFAMEAAHTLIQLIEASGKRRPAAS
jgi:uncharacterized protein (UPF0261 family)